VNRSITTLTDLRALGPDDLLKPGEVAAIGRVDVKTVARWANGGRIAPAVRTPGGHRRYRVADVRAMFGVQDDG
jgi:predicted site-specific integrase-resolvase